MADIIFQQPMTLVKCVGNDFRAHQLSPKIDFEHGKLYLLDTKQANKLLRRRGDQFLKLSTESIIYTAEDLAPVEDELDLAPVEDELDLAPVEDELDLDNYLNI